MSYPHCKLTTIPIVHLGYINSINPNEIKLLPPQHSRQKVDSFLFLFLKNKSLEIEFEF